jgi:alcohol dehydrogenase class IV
MSGEAKLIPVEFGDWPGRIAFGAGAVGKLAALVEQCGGSRALVLCGATVAGGEMLAKVKAGLGDKLVGVFAEVRAHTPIEMVERTLAQFRASGADIIVTVGGGSAIDAGKALAIMLASGGDLTRYAISYTPGGEMARRPLPARGVPHIAVPTTAGSGSEVMPTAGCRDPRSSRKLLFWDAALVPVATVLDPEMAVHTPAALTAATGMTAMARAVEALYSGKRHAISTALALHAVRLLRDALPRSIAAPHDLAARAACQMACTMSGMAAINAMVSVVHSIGHVVGGRHALQHGVSHAILLAPAMRVFLPVIGSDQTLLCDAIGGRAHGAPEAAAAEAAEMMSSFVRGLPLQQRLRDLDIPETELAEIAHLTMSDYMMANLPRPMPESEVLALLQSAW